MAVRAELILRDLLFVTHAVPADWVRPIVPEGLVIDTVLAPGGQPLALISTVFLCVESVHVHPFVSAEVQMPMMNHRVYLSRPRASLFFFRVGLGSAVASLMRPPMLPTLERVRVSTRIEPGPGGSPYGTYIVEASSREGVTRVDATVDEEPVPQPAGFSSWQAAVRFITDRPDGLFRATSGILGDLRVAHAGFNPMVARLRRGRFPVWQALGLPNLDDRSHLHSVLIQPQSRFAIRLPVLALRHLLR